MRLINTSTLQFQEFNHSCPQYAILSHTWGQEEVTFEKVKSLSLSTRMKAGFKKVTRFCELAKSQGSQFVWIDTCCIDKANLTELSEAINSMFRWYSEASLCYAYLADICTPDDLTCIGAPYFAGSRWFRRGWTLQELIAPRKVVFCSSTWVELGTKTEFSQQLSLITGIDESLLRSERSVDSFCIAEKMSWATDRQVTRVEDMAYSLLGIFGVNMPLLYGEGHAAFLRLQEEIMKVSDDDSLLSWNAHHHTQSSGTELDQIPILAPEPKFFDRRIRITLHRHNSPVPRAPFMMTNQGLQIRVLLVDAEFGIATDHLHGDASHYAVLNCEIDGGPIAIPLISTSKDLTRFVRAPLPTIRVIMLEEFKCTVQDILILRKHTRMGIVGQDEEDTPGWYLENRHLGRRRSLTDGAASDGYEMEKRRNPLCADLAAHLMYVWIIRKIFCVAPGWKELYLGALPKEMRSDIAWFGIWFYLRFYSRVVDLPRAAVVYTVRLLWKWVTDRHPDPF